MKPFFILIILLISQFLACKPNAGGDITPQKGYVSGRVTDTKGQPIQGAFVYMSSTGPYSSGASVHTDANGQYRIKMDYGAYRVYATFEKEYAGKTFVIQLKPDNSDSFSANDSPVINFKWVLTGQKPIPLVGTFGGYIGLYQGDTNIFKNEIEFIFTPLEFIDGSPVGNPIRIKPAEVSTQYLEDLPLGKYTVKAIHQPSDGGTARPVTLRNMDTEQISGSDGLINLEFKPESEGFFRANIEYFER